MEDAHSSVPHIFLFLFIPVSIYLSWDSGSDAVFQLLFSACADSALTVPLKVQSIM